MGGFDGSSMRRIFRNYVFVDYATQGYIGLVALLILLFHNETVPQWKALLLTQLCGIGLVHGIIQLEACRPAFAPLEFLRHFYPVLLYTWFFAETGWLNRMFFREFMDPVAIRWDQELFGCQPSVLFMYKLPWLGISELFYAAYFSYYVMIAGVGLALYIRSRRQFFHYVSVISFVFYLCYMVYIVLPIIGPRVFFHDVAGYSLPEAYQSLAVTDVYPKAVERGPFFQVMAFIYRVFEAPGAAFPSSHVAIALTTVFFSFRYLRPIRYLHLLVAVLLCLATIYCRYHYAVDVLAGILTAVLLVPLANWLYGRFGEALTPAHGSINSAVGSRN